MSGQRTAASSSRRSRCEVARRWIASPHACSAALGTSASTLTSRKAVDKWPERNRVVDDVDAHLRPVVGQANNEVPHPAAEPMLIHDEPVRDPEGPRIDVFDMSADLQFVPQPEVRFLDDVGRLLV